MTREEFIQDFIADHQVEIGVPSVKNNIYTRFALNYYDTYALLALNKHTPIRYLSEDLLMEIKPHKGKIYFRFLYNTTKNKYYLEEILYGATLAKCIRVITAIKRALLKRNIPTKTDALVFQHKTYTVLHLVT